MSQDTAEAAQGPAQQEQQQQQHAEAQQQGGGTRTTGVADGPGGPLAAAQRVDQGALAAQNAPGTVTLATAITMATQQFIQRVQAVQPTDEAMREMVREMVTFVSSDHVRMDMLCQKAYTCCVRHLLICVVCICRKLLHRQGPSAYIAEVNSRRR